MFQRGSSALMEQVDTVKEQVDTMKVVKRKLTMPLLLVNLAVSLWVLNGFLVTAPAGDIVCMSTHITMSLAYKPLSLSMLGVVATLCDMATWFRVDQLDPSLRKLQGHQDHDSDAPPLDINVFSSGALFVVALLVVAYFGQVRTARNSHSHLVTQKLSTFVE